MNLHLVALVIDWSSITVATIWTWISSTVTVCSILHTALPPWDFLNDFPTAQKFYKAFVYLVGYIATNWRSTLYPQLSTSNGSKISEVVKNGH